MTLHPQEPPSVPDDTSRVARAAFPKGTLCLQIAEALGPIWHDSQFAALFPRRGQPAEAPGLLALATVLQFVEGLSDRQAADAVRGRIDWKYLLGLSLTDPGFDHTVLSEFRSRLVEGGAERLLLDTLLRHLRELGLVKARGRQRTDSTHVLAAVRVLNRLERAGETVRAALNQLAVVAPEWLQAVAPAVWYERYSRRVENYRLPKSDQERLELASVIGADGAQLLVAVDATVDQPWMAQLPAVYVLREVWQAQYVEEDGKLRWRTVQEMPPSAEQIASPYEPDARYSKKRDISWLGYKAHLSETCDPGLPHVITNVETTPATTPDDTMLAAVHQSLAKSELLPSEHLIDMGYTGSQALLESQQQHDVVAVGPVPEDSSWQARAADGFAKAQFLIDWERQVITCPAGRQSVSWLPCNPTTSRVEVEVRFARKDCAACPERSRCTHAKAGPRVLALQSRQAHEALQSARQHQTTEEFKKRYAARAGIEGTHGQAIRRCGLRKARYIGLAKTRLQHVITAAAINVVRIAEWHNGTATATTRQSRFGALQQAA
jgi:transposase